MIPRVCRAARALISLNQKELAGAANISTQTLADFERGARKPHANNIAAIERVFKERGIEFLMKDGEIVGIKFENVK